MPRRRASSPADEEMEEQSHTAHDHGVRLQFKQPLTWKAGKPIAVAELLKRLEALSRELQSYDQDDGVARDSMLTVATELASQQLLSHKDKGVKAYTACCLVDIFKLCAPDAPLSAKELKVCAAYQRMRAAMS
jgi:sister-chromatid-cohesion protein PDS5